MNHFLFDNVHRIAVHFYGKKMAAGTPPLVLLHGFCEDASLWRTMIPLLEDIPVMAIDLPGFGQSDVITDVTMATYARAVAAVLDDLDVAQCVLVGHSLGGYVALEFAATRRHSLAGLGLFHSHPFPDNEARIAIRKRGIEMLRSGKRDLYVAQLFPNLFAPAFSLKHPDVVNAMIARGKEQPAEGIIAALEAMIWRVDHQETLKKTLCPALFLLGEVDTLVPLEQAWQATLLPRVASIEILPGVAHMGMMEATVQSAQILRDFYRLSIQGRQRLSHKSV